MLHKGAAISLKLRWYVVNVMRYNQSNYSQHTHTQDITSAVAIMTSDESYATGRIACGARHSKGTISIVQNSVMAT